MSYDQATAARFFPPSQGPVNENPGPDNQPWQQQGKTVAQAEIHATEESAALYRAMTSPSSREPAPGGTVASWYAATGFFDDAKVADPETGTYREPEAS